jgi:hypothetical protein
LDGRLRGGRTRPRPLDWVVGDARLHWARTRPWAPLLRADDGPAIRRFVEDYLPTSRRILEVCDDVPLLAADAIGREGLEYFPLVSIRTGAGAESWNRLGGSRLVGDPFALVQARLQFDLVAWLRERETLERALELSALLLADDGLLILRTGERFDAGRWIVGDASTLPSGRRLIAARRRGRANGLVSRDAAAERSASPRG